MRGEHEQSQLIGFLQAENKTLIEQNKQFKSLMTLNREALKIALQPRTNEEHLPALVSMLFQENSKLLEKNRLLREQIQSKTCQMLITEQIASASNDHQKYVTTQLKERLKILKKQLEKKDMRIVELTKQLGKPENTASGENQIGSMVVEYTQINKITQKMFKEADNLRREIDQKASEIDKLKQQKQELLKLNFILTKQVSELKAYSLQTTSSIKRQFNSSTTDMSKFLKYQSKIVTGSDDESEGHIDSDSDEDNSGSSGLDQIIDEDELEEEEKVQEPKMKPKISLALNLSKSKESELDKSCNAVIPKLDFKKAREIQSLIIKKINNDEKKKHGNMHKDEKYKKYETECEELRKRLGNEIILKLRFQKENSFLKKFISELEQRNELLLRDKQEKTMEQDYEKQRHEHEIQNVETILDICRDVTMNERLKAVCKGRQKLMKKNVDSNEV